MMVFVWPERHFVYGDYLQDTRSTVGANNVFNSEDTRDALVALYTTYHMEKANGVDDFVGIMLQ